MTNLDALTNALISIVYIPGQVGECKDTQKIIDFLVSELNYSIWYKKGVHNPLLAIAACLPFWEALNYLSSSICQVDNRLRGVLVAALSSLYPKYKDKRCFYQHISLPIDDKNSAVPLTSSACFLSNDDVDIKELKSGILKALYPCLALLRSSNLSAPQSAETIKSVFRRLLLILPTYVLQHVVDNDNSNNDTDTESGSSSSSSCYDTIYIVEEHGKDVKIRLSCFQRALWKCIAVAETHKLAQEVKDLDSFFSESPWALTHRLEFRGRDRLYSYFFESFVGAIRLLLSLGNPLAADLPVDNTPMLECSVLRQLMLRPHISSHGSPHPYPSSSSSRRQLARKLPLKGVTSVSIAKRMYAELEEQLESVQRSVELEVGSGACRSGDGLTSLCRHLVFMCRPTALSRLQSKAGGEGSSDDGGGRGERMTPLSRFSRRLLFQKRVVRANRRDGIGKNEEEERNEPHHRSGSGAVFSFLPDAVASLSSLLDEEAEGETTVNLLENIIASFPLSSS